MQTSNLRNKRKCFICTTITLIIVLVVGLIGFGVLAFAILIGTHDYPNSIPLRLGQQTKHREYECFGATTLHVSTASPASVTFYLVYGSEVYGMVTHEVPIRDKIKSSDYTMFNIYAKSSRPELAAANYSISLSSEATVYLFNYSGYQNFTKNPNGPFQSIYADENVTSVSRQWQSTSFYDQNLYVVIYNQNKDTITADQNYSITSYGVDFDRTPCEKCSKAKCTFHVKDDCFELHAYYAGPKRYASADLSAGPFSNDSLTIEGVFFALFVIVMIMAFAIFCSLSSNSRANPTSVGYGAVLSDSSEAL